MKIYKMQHVKLEFLTFLHENVLTRHCCFIHHPYVTSIFLFFMQCFLCEVFNPLPDMPILGSSKNGKNMDEKGYNYLLEKKMLWE